MTKLLKTAISPFFTSDTGVAVADHRAEISRITRAEISTLFARELGYAARSRH